MAKKKLKESNYSPVLNFQNKYVETMKERDRLRIEVDKARPFILEQAKELSDITKERDKLKQILVIWSDTFSKASLAVKERDALKEENTTLSHSHNDHSSSNSDDSSSSSSSYDSSSDNGGSYDSGSSGGGD